LLAEPLAGRKRIVHTRQPGAAFAQCNPIKLDRSDRTGSVIDPVRGDFSGRRATEQSGLWKLQLRKASVSPVQ
jgi:hypothetical protein